MATQRNMALHAIPGSRDMSRPCGGTMHEVVRDQLSKLSADSVQATSLWAA